MDSSTSEKNIPRNLLILSRIRATQNKQKETKSAGAKPESVQKINCVAHHDANFTNVPEEARRIEPNEPQKKISYSKFGTLRENTVTQSESSSGSQEVLDIVSNHNVKSDVPAETQRNESKDRLKRLLDLKHRQTIRQQNDASSLSSDCSIDDKYNIIRRSKLQEHIYLNVCNKENTTCSIASTDSSSICSESEPRKETSPSINAFSRSNQSSSGSDFKPRRFNRRKYYVEDDEEFTPTESLLHLKKPCYDEKNHTVYYDNHGRMEPIDWSAVIEKDKKTDDQKTKAKVSKHRVIMGPAEAFLLEPIPEFCNAVANSIDEDSVYKVSDNIQRTKSSRDFSPLLKIERAINMCKPKILKVSANDKKQLKSSSLKLSLVDKTNLPTKNEENEKKTDDVKSNEVETSEKKFNKNKLSLKKSENSETTSEFESDTLSSSIKKNEASVNEIKKELSEDEDDMFEFEKPKSHNNNNNNDNDNKNTNQRQSNGPKPKFSNDNKNKNSYPANGAKSKSNFDNNNKNTNQYDGGYKPRYDNKNKNANPSVNGYKPRYYDNKNKNTTPPDGESNQKSHSKKKFDHSNRNKKRSWNLEKFTKLDTTLDSDDASSVKSETSSISFSAKFEAIKRNILAKTLAKVTDDVNCSESSTVSDEHEFLLKENHTRYFKESIRSAKVKDDEVAIKTSMDQQESLMVEVETKHFSEKSANELLGDRINHENSNEKIEKKAVVVDASSDAEILPIDTENVLKEDNVESQCMDLNFSDANITFTKNIDGECLKSSRQTCSSNLNNNKGNDKSTESNIFGSTSEEKETSKIQKIVKKINYCKNIVTHEETVLVASSDNDHLKNSGQPILENSFSGISDDEDTEYTSAAEISFEKEGIPTIQETPEEVHADHNSINSNEKVFKQGDKEVYVQETHVKSVDDKSGNIRNQSAPIENDSENNKTESLDKKNISDNEQGEENENNSIDFEKSNLETSKISSTSYEPKLEDLNKNILKSEHNNCTENINQIIICDTTNEVKKSSVVIEEIDDDAVNCEDKSISTSKKSIDCSTKPLNDDSDDYDIFDLDGFDCVNLDQFTPFSAMFKTLRSLKESSRPKIEDSGYLKSTDVQMNGLDEENNASNCIKSIENSIENSANNHYSSIDANVSSNLGSDSEKLSHSSESISSINTEDNVFSNVNADEIHLDNCSLNQGNGEPYYCHLLVNKPKNESTVPGKLNKMSQALKNYKNKNMVVNSENEIQESSDGTQVQSQMTQQSKRYFHLLNEVKKHKLHLSCKPLS